jgi:hypothetical protein
MCSTASYLGGSEGTQTLDIFEEHDERLDEESERKGGVRENKLSLRYHKLYIVGIVVSLCGGICGGNPTVAGITRLSHYTTVHGSHDISHHGSHDRSHHGCHYRRHSSIWLGI